MLRAVFLATAATLAIASHATAAPCRDIPTVWTLNGTFGTTTTATRIYSDGASYSDGSEGVSATIKLCSGTNDAVLIVGGGRTILFNFGGAFLAAGSTAAPVWTSGAFASPPPKVRNCGGSPCTILNIRNILDSGAGPRNQYYLLHTRLDSALVAPDKASYHLQMHNRSTCPNVACDSNDDLTNFPNSNARVIVEHYPSSDSIDECSFKECWLVYPETSTPPGSMSPSQNAVLMSNDRTINFGQFSMPFSFTIIVK